MYFPFLRGKQFELLALRELSNLPLNPSKVSPIIEPLKKDIKSILTMVTTLPKTLKIQLIINSQYGELKGTPGHKIIATLVSKFHDLGYQNIIPAFIISNNEDFNSLKKLITEYGFDSRGFSLIHLNQIAAIEGLSEIASSINCLYNIISINHIMALRRKFPKQTIAYLTDPFIRQIKNSAYTDVIDENFSNEHLFYKEEGFVGYGDYLTIGSEFIDGGRLPWAVAIHLTYQDSDRNIRIRHFVSDSNSDDSDTAGKFAEALDKLIKFIETRNIHSIATEVFRDLYSRGAFPGLGTIKKLSIMHHIELIQSLM